MDGTSVPTCFLFAEGIGGGNQHISQHVSLQSWTSSWLNVFWQPFKRAAREKQTQACSNIDARSCILLGFFFSFFPPSFTSLRLLSAQLSLTVSECLSVSIMIRRFAFGSRRLGSTPRSLNLREAESQSAVGAAKMKLRCLEGRPAG